MVNHILKRIERIAVGLPKTSNAISELGFSVNKVRDAQGSDAVVSQELQPGQMKLWVELEASCLAIAEALAPAETLRAWLEQDKKDRGPHQPYYMMGYYGYTFSFVMSVFSHLFARDCERRMLEGALLIFAAIGEGPIGADEVMGALFGRLEEAGGDLEQQLTWMANCAPPEWSESWRTYDPPDLSNWT